MKTDPKDWQELASAKLQEVGPPWDDRLVMVWLDRRTALVVSRRDFANKLEENAAGHEPTLGVAQQIRACGPNEIPIVHEDIKGVIGLTIASVGSWTPTNAKGGAA